MMKKLLLAAIPALLLSLTVACVSDSAVIDCESDVDCTDAAAPVCDTVAGFCVGDVPDECSDNVDCQLINPDAPTTVENWSGGSVGSD